MDRNLEAVIWDLGFRAKFQESAANADEHGECNESCYVDQWGHAGTTKGMMEHNFPNNGDSHGKENGQ